jgi:hypothetical protein
MKEIFSNKVFAINQSSEVNANVHVGNETQSITTKLSDRRRTLNCWSVRMKKSSFVMCTILVALCTVFASCDGKKKDAPTIKLTYDGVVKNNGEEVEAKVGEEVTVTAEYNAPGKINAIFLHIGTNPIVSIPDNTAFAQGSDKKNTTREITRTVKFEGVGETLIKTSIEDKQKDALTTNFEMKVIVK